MIIQYKMTALRQNEAVSALDKSDIFVWFVLKYECFIDERLGEMEKQEYRMARDWKNKRKNVY